MIPIKLEFEAFGPFAKHQIIDFSEFENDRLFLISGQTGSGKTTIFDAITFSLYGQASGSTRQADTFKSDFADDKTICYIIFEFIVKGNRYIVRREPMQYRLKRNQNIVKESSTATLAFEDGNIISGPQNVDKYIEELLGINADQFKKIVMLPQGEFRRFLSDDSNEKQKILRKIFSTKILDDFTEQLRLNVNQLKNNLESKMTECNAYINSIVCIENSEISLEIDKPNHDIAYIIGLLKNYNISTRSCVDKIKSELTQLNDKKQAINLPYYEEINSKFKLLNKTKLELETLTNQEHDFKSIENKIKLLKEIKDILPLDKEIKSISEQLYQLNEKLSAYQQNIINNKIELELTTKNYEIAKQNKETIPSIVKNIEDINKQQELLSEIELVKKQIDEIIQNQKNLTDNSRALNNFRKHILICNEIEQVNNITNELILSDKSIEQYKNATAQYLIVNKEYQTTFNAFISGQAYMLSSNLEKDVPCPVCGSTLHPNPAKNNGEHVSQEKLDEVKNIYEQVSQQVESIVATCKQQIANFKFDEAHDIITDYIPYIKQQINDNYKQIEKLKANLSEISLRNDLKGISPPPKLESVDKKIGELEKTVAVNEEKYETATLLLDKLTEKLVDKLANKQSLTIKTEKLNTQIKSINQVANELENKLDVLKLTQERNLEAIRQSNELITSYQANKDETIIKFNSYLNKLKIDLETFNSNKVAIDNITTLEENLSVYKNSVSVKLNLINTLSEQLQGKSIVDILILQEKLNDINSEIENKNQEYIKQNSALNSNTSIYIKLTEVFRHYNEVSNEYSEVNKLFEVANGKYSDRLNFERYVLATYFNDVIENANLRLEQMTNSRYTLIRRVEKEKGNKSSGLELDVFDSYTGKSRHVNTLSGGESFKIALSLALGLADIISQNSGGIEINTMFIDEGFGSLDSNSLDSAIQCLCELSSSGRYIGIISHVNELKEKIPAKIVVVQQLTGSYIEK